MSSFSFIFARNVASLSFATLRCAFCGAFRWTSTAPPGSFYLYAPAGVTKGQALNTVPADNRQGHRSLATGGPLLGGLTPTDWTRVLYQGATHRRAGGGGGERTDRQGGGRKGGDRNTETESVKHRHAVSGGVSRAVKRTWLRGRGRSRSGGEDGSRAALFIDCRWLVAFVLVSEEETEQNQATRRGRCRENRLGHRLEAKKKDGRNRVLAVAASGEWRQMNKHEPRFWNLGSAKRKLRGLYLNMCINLNTDMASQRPSGRIKTLQA